MRKHFLLILLLFVIAGHVFGQERKKEKFPELHSKEWKEMNQSKEKTLEWFKNAKYGMFIHWGLYSIPAGIWDGVKIDSMRGPHVAEWIMHAFNIPRSDYAKLANEFYPEKFNADEIAKLAKDAGMKYLVITSKHHDGFALFDSKVSEYDIMDASPFKRDIIKELHEACKKQGIEFGVYYSHNIDWYDGADAQVNIAKHLYQNLPAYQYTFGANTWDPSPNSFEDYLVNKAFPQVEELMNQYPEMKLLWYDMSPRMTAEQSYAFYKKVYDIQPQIIITERIGNGYGDYTIPGDNTIPKEYEDLIKPWETVGTFNNSWGYNCYDDDWKSPEEVLFWLVEIVSRGGNYMLNIGPDGEGAVPGESVKTLKAIGKWLAVNGEAIYNTKRWIIAREGPTDLNFSGTGDRAKKGFQNNFTDKDFWFTHNDEAVYCISLVSHAKKIVVKSFANDNLNVKRVNLLGCSEKIKWEQTKAGLVVILPEKIPAKHGFVLKIVTDN